MMLRGQRLGERGVALAMVLVAAVLVSITAAIALSVSGHRLHRAQMLQQHDTSYYVDEAGMQLAFIKLAKNLPPFNTPPVWNVNAVRTEAVTIGGRAVTISVTRVADGTVSGRPNPQYSVRVASTF